MQPINWPSFEPKIIYPNEINTDVKGKKLEIQQDKHSFLHHWMSKWKFLGMWMSHIKLVTITMACTMTTSWIKVFLGGWVVDIFSNDSNNNNNVFYYTSHSIRSPYSFCAIFFFLLFRFSLFEHNWQKRLLPGIETLAFTKPCLQHHVFTVVITQCGPFSFHMKCYFCV